MMERRVHFLSPHIQAVFAEAVRKFVAAAERGDVDAAFAALEMLYLAAPNEAKAKADKIIREAAGEGGRRRHPLATLKAIIDDHCSVTLAEYGRPMREKEQRCVSEALELLLTIFDTVIRTIYETGGMYTVRDWVVGGGVAGSA